MGATLSRSVHSASGFFGVHVACAIVFAVVYSIVNVYVVEELVRRALASDSTPGERAGLRAAIARSPLVKAAVAKQTTKRKSLSAPREANSLIVVDRGATLANYQDRAFTYWLMNSLLIQAGVGGGFSHLSTTQRVVVITQTVMVLAISAFSVAYGTI